MFFRLKRMTMRGMNDISYFILIHCNSMRMKASQSESLFTETLAHELGTLHKCFREPTIKIIKGLVYSFNKFPLKYCSLRAVKL